MNKIIVKDGSILTQTNAILEETKQFYNLLMKTEKQKIVKLNN